MMWQEQPDLFNTPAPPLDKYPNAPGFARGSDTSKAAAEKTQKRLGHLHLRILNYLAEQGERGAIYTDIVEACDLAVPTVCGRVRELILQGYVRDSGERRSTPSNCKARVCVRTSKPYEISNAGA